MTYDERQIKECGWLKVDCYAVTKSLRTILYQGSLQPEEQRRLAFIQNEVLTSAEEGQEGRWERISSRLLKKCGDDYTRYIRQLEDWGQLGSVHSYIPDVVPMPYWIPRPALESGICTMECRRQRLRPPVPDNHPTDDASRYALKCLSELEVLKDGLFWLPKEPIHRSLIKDHCEHIFFKDFSLGYGKESKRLFHRVIMMPSEGRPNLKHPFLPLVEYDLKTCHPYLVTTLFDDTSERLKYQDLINRDIYAEIRDAKGIDTRDTVKTDFMRVFYRKDRDREWLERQYVFQFFAEHFPRFTKSVLCKRSDLALSLQNFEADLMVQRLGAYCRREGLFWFPQHDGWITTVSDGERIHGFADEIIRGAVGFPAKFIPHPLNQNGSL